MYKFLLLSLFAVSPPPSAGFFFFCTVEFPQLFQVFIRNFVIVTGEKKTGGGLYYITVNFSTSVASYGNESEDKSSF